MPRPVRTVILAFSMSALVPLLADPGPSAWAAPPAEETIYQSSDLRIYRTVNRDGAPVVVLTNVDAEGQYFPGRPADSPRREERAFPPYAPPPAAPVAAPERPQPPPVKVVVNRGEGEDPAAEAEVASDTGGGTTVIINIHPPAPPPRETAVLPVAYVPVSYGGLVGPFRYPDHQYFLGYAPGTASPSFFGGLGLNAGNGFGLKTGASCDRGYDCMFGPTGDHP